MARVSTLTLTASVLLSVLLAATLLPAPGDAMELGVQEKFLKHYAKIKILESCFGHDTVFGWYTWLEAIMVQCRKDTTMVKVKRNADHDHYHDPDTPFYTEESIRSLMKQVQHKIDFVNCTFNMMNITMTADGGVETQSLVDYFNTLELDADLKKDTIEGIKKCGMASSCSDSFHKSYGPLDVPFQTKLQFSRCEQEQRVLACVKHDLRKHRNQFQFEGLDGLLDDVADDADKMLAIVSAKFSIVDTDTFI